MPEFRADPAITAPVSATAVPSPETATFLVGAFAVTWAMWGFAAVTDSPLSDVLNVLGGFAPMAVALAVTARAGGRPAVRALLSRFDVRRGDRLAYLPAVAIVIAIAVAVVVGAATGDTFHGHDFLVALPMLPVNILVVVLAGGGNEELAWRGYLLPRLQFALPPLSANLVMGLIWGVWHCPLWSIPGSTQAAWSFPWFVVLAVAVSVLIGWATNRADGGVWPAIAGHTALNVGLLYLQDALGTVHMAALAVLLVVAALPAAHALVGAPAIAGSAK